MSEKSENGLGILPPYTDEENASRSSTAFRSLDLHGLPTARPHPMLRRISYALTAGLAFCLAGLMIGRYTMPGSSSHVTILRQEPECLSIDVASANNALALEEQPWGIYGYEGQACALPDEQLKTGAAQTTCTTVDFPITGFVNLKLKSFFQVGVCYYDAGNCGPAEAFFGQPQRDVCLDITQRPPIKYRVLGTDQNC